MLPPFAGPVDLAPRIVDLDADKLAAWTRRPGTLAVDGDAAEAEVAKGLQLGVERFRAGLERSAHAEVLRRILDDGPGAVRDDDVDRAVLLAMAPGAATADLLVARFGLEAVVRTLAQGPLLHVERDLRTAWLVPGEDKLPKVRPAAARLRDLLRHADEGTWAACEAMASAALQRGGRFVLELVTMFPATAWVDGYLRLCGLSGPVVQVAGCAGVEAFCDLWQGRKPTLHNGLSKLLPQLEQVLLRHGAEAAPAVFLLAEGMGAEGMPLMARVRSADGVGRLLELLDDKVRGSSARAALVGMSDLTLATLAGMERPKKAWTELAEELARQPGLVPQLLPHLDTRRANRVRRWAGDQEQLELVDQVPAVLSTSSVPLEPWLRLPDLPPLRIPDGSKAYPASATAHLVGRLMEAVDEALVEQVLAACDPASVDEVVAGVWSAWSEGASEALYGTSPWRLVTEDHDDEWDDAPPRTRWVRDRNAPEEMEVPWVLHAVDAFGGDACSEALFRAIVAWGARGGRYPELLSQTIDSMCRLPGEGNLVRLGALARRVQKAKVRIEQHLARVARESGLSREHLDEMLLPTLGLDGSGRIELDYGSRAFMGTFDTALHAVLLDPDGKARSSLPKPTAKDDAARAKAAQASWKELKEQARTLRTTLLGRLELALRTQRSWDPDLFLRYLAVFLVLGAFALAACVGVAFDRDALFVLGFVALLELATVGTGLSSFRKVVLSDEELVYSGLLGSSRVRLDAIGTIEPGQALRIVAGPRTLVIRMGQRGVQGQLAQVLRQRLPGAFHRRDALPFTWRPRGQVVGVNLVFLLLAVGMAGLGGLGLLQGGWDLLHRQWADGLATLFAAGMMVLVGVGMTLLLLTTTLLRVDFTAERITARYPVRWKRFAASGLKTVLLASETRTYRGISRTAWFLDLGFDDQRTLRIEPTENGVPADFAPDSDRDELTVLRDDLRRLYGVDG